MARPKPTEKEEQERMRQAEAVRNLPKATAKLPPEAAKGGGDGKEARASEASIKGGIAGS